MNLFFGDRPGRPRVTRPYKDDDVWQVQQVVRFSLENANSSSCLLPLDTGQTLELLISDHSVTDHVYLCSTCKVEW